MKWFFKREWPKRIKIEVRDGNAQLLDFMIVKINSWDEVMEIGSKFAQDTMIQFADDNIDECYWRFEEYNGVLRC
jgi:hypothetical protein